MLSLLLVWATASTLVAALPAGNPPAAIKWGSCGRGSAAHVECGRFEVPINWDQLGGQKISLAVSRIKTASKNRIGTILYNPGGPGKLHSA